MRSAEAAQAAGITERQLGLWIAEGYLRVPAVGTGRTRIVPDHEVTVLRHMARLIRVGLRTKSAAEIARLVADTGHGAVVLAEGLTLTIGKDESDG